MTRIKKLEQDCCELEEELEHTNSALRIKERQSTDEIQDARTELVRVVTYILKLCFHLLSFIS